MAMLTLQGQVTNVFSTPGGTNQKGETYSASDKVQVIAENELKNGEKRIELLTLTTDNPALFKTLLGKSVRIPVGIFVSGNQPQYYILKAGKVEAM